MKNFPRNAFKTFVLVLFTCILGNTASAQTAPAKAPASVVGVTSIIDKFFKSYENDGTSKAVIEIFKTNPLVDPSSLTKLIAKIDTTRGYIGPYVGKELLVQRKATNSLVLYSYLAKHQNQPIRFTFMFYKAKNDWAIYRLYFDDQIDNELEESAKVTGKP
ncbi:hypothetical protein SAMN05216464_104146 [Mucilaginibacter pineti]|uniref:DUF3887 domain-containing protein n=1 Tax=Mucilaginibacter pineti TaxID=1391627 RepID=A0A1G7AKK6_9SPHI|nr:hypothetical protein [Mucilaginibacter pineti]SDE15250.1 hypothetical protein SAMN05216464_104146 [Mucilaginibacter pineti]